MSEVPTVSLLELLENQARLRHAHETLCKHGEVYGLCFLTIFTMYARVLRVSLLPYIIYRIMYARTMFTRAQRATFISLFSDEGLRHK